MNQPKPLNREHRSRRARASFVALIAVVGAAFAQASCAEGGTVDTSQNTTGNPGGGGNSSSTSGGSGGSLNPTNSGGGGSAGKAGSSGSSGSSGSAGSGGSSGSSSSSSGGTGGSVTCVPETCDGEDNDCDGTVDNDDPGGGKSCTTNLKGVCAVGVTKCINAEVKCVPSVEPGMNAETCNGMDDNCDGTVDEGDPGGGNMCMAAAFGQCKLGIEKCVNGAVKCQPGTPTPEVCDGLDNNCDGNNDEGNPGGGLQCMTGFFGICASGITQCDGMAGVICEPSVTPGLLMESCNGLDDDCDNQVDEGIAQVGQACTAMGFVGICQFGTYSCPNQAPFQLKCDHPAPGTIQETCNSQDDDCNGTIDDPMLLNNMPCTTVFPGVCMAGKTQCSGGSQSCVPNVAPGSQSELCNSVDDNCDGTVDNVPNTNAACTTQNPNAMFVANWACAAGNCQIQGCQAGHANIDQAPGNGCECTTDAYSNACNTAGTQSVPSGGSVNMVGKIEQASGSDFLKLNFTVSGVGAPYHPKVQLVDSGGGQYAMDVLATCQTPTACSTTGGANNENGQSVTVWEQNFDGYTPGAGCCSDNTPRAASVIVRVFRKFGDAPTCSPYTVTATNM